LHLEEFAEGQSPWHRMDPRVKVLGLTGLAVVTAVSDRLEVLLVALVLGLTILATAKLDLKKVGFRLMVVNFFVLFLWLFLPFTTPGETVYTLGPLGIKREGLELAIAVTMKTNAIIAATIGLIGTSTIFNLVHGLTHMYVPEKLVHLFFYCYRYITVIHEEYEALRSALRIRCFVARTDAHTYRTYAYLLGMIFVRTFERSERIYQAMELRGFTGTFYTLNHIHMHRRDWVALGCFTLCVGCLAILQWGGVL
jgi:cobalt/nickel transport system permease protein